MIVNEIKKENIILEILEKEWVFFQLANNKGGRASCQDNREEFIIMRKSQWETFPINILESYLDDLINYGQRKINPVVEKYGKMMEFSVPKEYEEIKAYLKLITEDKKEIIESIIVEYLKWEKEVLEKYPKVFEKGRPLLTVEDKEDVTSIESYLRGELYSYSIKTLKLYKDYILECKINNRNLAKENIENIAKYKGYDTLDKVEKLL